MRGFRAPLERNLRTGGQISGRPECAVLAGAFCLLWYAGCATAHRAPPAAPAAPPAEPAGVPTAVPSEATPAVTVQTMLIESIPPGAVIVVDGRPVGKAPVRIAVPDTPQGFFREYMEIRARFVATDPAEESRTVMEEFTPREKVPAALQFTPAGPQRSEP